MGVSEKTFVKMEKNELEAFAKANREAEAYKQKLREMRSGGNKKSSGKKGSHKSSMVKIGNEKFNRSEVRELAEKGLALANKKENESDRNSELRKHFNVFKEQFVITAGGAAFLSWAEAKLDLFKRIPEITAHPSARFGLLAAGFYYMAEKEKDYKWKIRWMGAANAAVALAGAKFGANFQGANDIAAKINQKTSAAPALTAVP